MYNGIGLKTARGSGTNGYVTRNLSFVKPKFSGSKPYNYDEMAVPQKTRKPNDAILLHKSKRQIEVECLQLRERLETQQYAGRLVLLVLRPCRLEEEEIERQVKRLKAELTAKLEERLANTKDEVLMERKEREMLRLKDAFGIKSDHKEGHGFRFETERQKEERMTRIDEEERALKRQRRI